LWKSESQGSKIDMPTYEFAGLTPVVAATTFIHPTAILIGDVIIGRRCYVGPGAVLRGDMGRILVGDGSNIQDNCVLHSFPGAEMVVEEDGHIGHAAILHGCRIGKNALVGMNAVVMDGASIGENSFVGAMTFVKANMSIPSNSLVVGAPGRVVRTLTQEELTWKIAGTQEYHRLVEHSGTLRECIPLKEPEAERPHFGKTMLPLSDHRSARERSD
jgi:phenylacetic acid degradation protein